MNSKQLLDTDLRNFEASVLKMLQNDKVNEALFIIRKFVAAVLNDSGSIATAFGSPILDQLCQKIGARTFKKLDKENVDSNAGKNLVIYIGTELYKYGGHTRVILDLIEARPEKQHLILLTQLFDRDSDEVIDAFFDQSNVSCDFSAVNTPMVDKLYWLQKKLSAYPEAEVILFNHQQDSIAVAAVQPDINKEVYFHHHCDQQITLGVYLPFVTHVDCIAARYYACKEELGLNNTVYWPLCVEELGCRDNSSFYKRGTLTTCTSGTLNKFTSLPYYPFNYFKVVPYIIQWTNGWHIHIGPLDDSLLDKIKGKLSELSIDEERFIHIPWVKSLCASLLEQQVDIYISSFPLGGSRASIEALGSGTPVITHRNILAPALSAVGIGPENTPIWNNLAELKGLLTNMNMKKLQQLSQANRKNYEDFHTKGALIDAINNKLSSLPPNPPGHYPDTLDVYLIRKKSLGA